jgi:hypothetical protein
MAKYTSGIFQNVNGRRVIPLQERRVSVARRTKTIEKGTYELREDKPGPYAYRVTNGLLHWMIYKQERTAPEVLDPKLWIFVESGFRTKDSALDYCLELIEKDKGF